MSEKLATLFSRHRSAQAPVALPFPTTDAHRWASEFVRLHGGDEGLMLAWFANAIEHGRMVGARDGHE